LDRKEKKKSKKQRIKADFIPQHPRQLTLPSITSQGRIQWIIKQYSHIEVYYASSSNPKQPKIPAM
jgi:hypothetical protein